MARARSPCNCLNGDLDGDGDVSRRAGIGSDGSRHRRGPACGPLVARLGASCLNLTRRTTPALNRLRERNAASHVRTAY